MICPTEVNQAIGDEIPTQGSRISFRGVDQNTIVGQNDDVYRALTIGFLGEPSDIEGVCADLVFSDMWE